MHWACHDRLVKRHPSHIHTNKQLHSAASARWQWATTNTESQTKPPSIARSSISFLVMCCTHPFMVLARPAAVVLSLVFFFFHSSLDLFYYHFLLIPVNFFLKLIVFFDPWPRACDLNPMVCGFEFLGWNCRASLLGSSKHFAQSQWLGVLIVPNFAFVCQNICLLSYAEPFDHIYIYISYIYLSIGRSIYLSIFLSIYLSNYLSIYPSIYLSIYLSFIGFRTYGIWWLFAHSARRFWEFSFVCRIHWSHLHCEPSAQVYKFERICSFDFPDPE